MTNIFSNTNLQGADFRGKTLINTDFSGADIRGANFRDAILIGANFCNAKAGLPVSRVISLIIVSILLSFLTGLISAYSGALINELLTNSSYGALFFGLTALITSIILLIVIYWQGLGVQLATVAGVIAACLIAVIAFADNDTAVGAQFTALALAGIIAGIGNIALAIAIAKIIYLKAAFRIMAVTAIVGAVVGALLGISEEAVLVVAIPVTSLVAVATIVFGIHAGKRAILGNHKFRIICNLAIAIVAKGGTSFYSADLTEADFTNASLKHVDFRRSILARTCFFQVQKLDNARVEGTYLENQDIRQLAVTKDGRYQKFDKLNLRCVNLKNAQLQDASFISTDLSAATLENANLSGVKLVETQLYQADLTNACLTGACIENWGISTVTKLEKIKCEFIYTQLGSQSGKNYSRKPDNDEETFQEGDFTDFIRPIIKTLDLYQKQDIDPREVGKQIKTIDLVHRKNIDPTAIAIALKQLSDNHPEVGLKLSILDRPSSDKIRIQALVAGDANLSQLSTEYADTYNQVKSLSDSELRAVLAKIAETDEQISNLNNLLENAMKQPKFYIETYQIQGDFIMSEGSKKVSSYDLKGAQFAGGLVDAETVTAQQVGGNITNNPE